MTTVVTGGSGLVGEAIRSMNLSNFIFLSSKECDLTDYNSTLKLFQKLKPVNVIHLAARVGGLFKNMRLRVEMLEDNLLINTNVVRASYAVGVKKFIGCLSTCIFPDNTTYPINENMLHDGPPHPSNAGYAYAKRMLDVQCECYREQYGVDYYCIIPTNVYGEHDNFNLDDAHVIPALIHKCYIAKRDRKKFKVSGTGRPLRQFIYSRDLAKLILWCLENHSHNNMILSVNPEDETSIRDVAECIAAEFEYNDNIVFDISLSDGQYKKTVDNSLLVKTMGYVDFTPISTGIKKTVEWFIENWDTLRK